MVDLSRADEILKSYENDKGALVKALQAVQDEFNYLPKETLLLVAEKLDVPLSEVLRVATFYKAFSLEPRGRHCINVCLGTACHVRGGTRLLNRIEGDIGIGVRETTDDMGFSLDVVRCLGCCSMAPVLRVGNDVHGRVRLDRVSQLLNHYRQEEKK